MIYAYRHLPHRIEKFHENFIYFFQKMVEKDLAGYNEKELLKAEFAAIVNNSGKLVGEMRKIIEQYHLLSESDKTIVKQALTNNCEIENLCANSGGFTPIKYEQISSEAFRNLLKGFLTELWEGYHFVNAIRDNFGTVQEHFNAFVSANHQRALICAFCGLYPLKPNESIHRNAYDHYIPKSLYPFISINFHNLFPICHECNSDEKTKADTLFNGGARRQVFYPLDANFSSNDLSISVDRREPYNQENYKTLLSDIEWQYSITIAGNADQRITSWDEIFNIKRRYRENILRYQSEWYDEILMKYRREKAKGTSYNSFRNGMIEDAEYQRMISPLGILRHTYFHFLFSNEELENELSEMTKMLT
jgi:hypothetical protein